MSETVEKKSSRPPTHDPHLLGGPRPALVNVDGTGMSMSWSTARYLLAAIAVLVSSAYGAAQSLVFDADLRDHDSNEDAHKIIVEGRLRKIPSAELLSAHEVKLKEIPRIAAQQVEDGKILHQIRASQFEGEAERLADQAVKSLPPRKRGGVWDHVRKTALENQYAGKPIRSGLRQYFESR